MNKFLRLTVILAVPVFLAAGASKSGAAPYAAYASVGAGHNNDAFKAGDDFSPASCNFTRGMLGKMQGIAVEKAGGPNKNTVDHLKELLDPAFQQRETANCIQMQLEPQSRF